MKLYITENNSWWYTKYLNCSIYNKSEEKPYKLAVIECDSVDEWIKKFEDYFDLDFEYENSYEWNSCNCCGRRFELECESDETSYKYADICKSDREHYNFKNWEQTGEVLYIN